MEGLMKNPFFFRYGCFAELRTDGDSIPPQTQKDLLFHFLHNFLWGAYWFRPDDKRFRLRVVVGRLATLKVDQASIAEAQFSLAA